MIVTDTFKTEFKCNTSLVVCNAVKEEMNVPKLLKHQSAYTLLKSLKCQTESPSQLSGILSEASRVYPPRKARDCVRIHSRGSPTHSESLSVRRLLISRQG